MLQRGRRGGTGKGRPRKSRKTITQFQPNFLGLPKRVDIVVPLLPRNPLVLDSIKRSEKRSRSRSEAWIEVTGFLDLFDFVETKSKSKSKSFKKPNSYSKRSKILRSHFHWSLTSMTAGATTARASAATRSHSAWTRQTSTSSGKELCWQKILLTSIFMATQ